MKIGFLDCFAGMSSSRLIGALASAGVPEQILHNAVDALDIGARLELMHIKRNNVATTKAHISISSLSDDTTPYYELPTFIQGISPQNHTIADQMYALGTIQALISNATLPAKAKDMALLTFKNLAEAEAQVSGMPMEEIYFHKVKALNTVVGITVCCVACTWLEVDKWYASPINVGSGFLKLPQGSLPIPTPTTLELLGEDAVIFASGPQKELLTSTCAALLKTMNVHYASCPAMSISRVGYGAGRIEYDSLPNFLRLCIGTVKDTEKQSAIAETAIIEAEFTKMSPKALLELQEQLYEHGARFVYTIPISSSFSQLAEKLVIFALPEKADEIRFFLFQRLQLAYIHWRIEKYDNLIHYDEYILSPWGKVKVRVGQLLNSQLVSVIPDQIICEKIAQNHDLPCSQVVETVRRLFISSKK